MKPEPIDFITSSIRFLSAFIRFSSGLLPRILAHETGWKTDELTELLIIA
jgi:hypothetical protein